MRRIIICLLTLAALGASAAVAYADFPYLPGSGGNPHDPLTFKVPPGEVPINLKDDYKFSATPEIPSVGIPSNPSSPSAPPADGYRVNSQADELCGVRGASIADQNATQPAETPVDPRTGGPCNIAGQTVHTAFNVTTGRPNVTIAVLDSGIKWNDAGAMTALANKVHLNQGELPAPRVDRSSLIPGTACPTGTATGGNYNAAGNYDVNGDGVFNIKDYACDSRVNLNNPRRHGPAGVMTPEDLILAFSDGADHDHNGFANDIAGWNFVDNNNNAFDDVQYGHGTGEALDSNGEAYKDAAHKDSDLGTCPNCMVLPLRVGESFIADVNRFAQAVAYATDSGALVVQEALGTLNNSNLARQAVNYAYTHGTVIIASAADEAAEHHNQPGALPHTIVVNSVRPYDGTFTATPRSYLQFNGCTNFSTKITISVPSSSCSSEATGKSAGVAGLIYSAALNAHAQGNLPASQDCKRPDGSACIITPNEVRQLMGTGTIGSTTPADTGNAGQADDVNFGGPADLKSCTATPAPTCTDPNFFTFAPDQNGGAVGPLASRRYPARKGFDEFYGFGRLNAYRAVNAAGASTIPPEAEINSPDWFQQIDPSQRSLPVQGHVYARGAAYSCQVYVAPGGQPNNGLTTDTPPGDFIPVSAGYCNGSTLHAGAYDGTLGTIDLNALKSRFPSGNGSFNGPEGGPTNPQTSNGRPNTLPYAFTVRVVVSTGAGSAAMAGEDRRQMFLHRDQDMLKGFPKELLTDGDSSPVLADLNGDNKNELVLATSDGVVHAYQPDGSELPGWPVHTDSLPLHTGERAFTSGGISTGHYGTILAAVATGDLFHNGTLDVVVDDNQGKVYAWDPSGHQVFKQEANPAFDGNPATSFERKGSTDRVEHGFFASPVLANLAGNKNAPLDIIAAGEDRHLYAWHADGRSVPGFPLLVTDPSKVAAVAPRTDHVTFKSDAAALMQGKIVDTPAVADVNGDGKPEIVIGTNEEYSAGKGSEGAINSSDTSLGVLGNAGVLSFGNSRLYVVKPDGNASGRPFLAGWPKKVGVVNTELLPDVGEGITGNPVVGKVGCQQDANSGGPKIGVEPDAGFAYLFNPNGSSCYGSSNGQDTPLATSGSAGSGQTDRPAIAAVGNPAFGNIGPGGTPAFLGPVTGVLRALDIVAPEYQGGQDFLAAWDPKTGQFQSGFPSPVNDLQFLTGPAVGDVTGSTNPAEAALEGTASLDLAAINSAGLPVSNSWPKLTGDWTVANPLLGSFGTLDTEASARKDVVSVTRSGTLAVYTTPAPACAASSWPRFHHDIANSGDFNRDAVPPGRIDSVTLAKNTVSFTAPGNDLMCGTVDRYEVVGDSGQTLAGVPKADIKPAGSRQTLTLGAYVGNTVTISAIDAAGNRGRAVTVNLFTGTVTVQGPGAGQPGGSGGAGRGGGHRGPGFTCLLSPLSLRSGGRALGPARLGARQRTLNVFLPRQRGSGFLNLCVRHSRFNLIVALSRGRIVLAGTHVPVRGALRPGTSVRRIRGLRRVPGVIPNLYRKGSVYVVFRRGRVSYLFITTIRNRAALRRTIRQARF